MLSPISTPIYFFSHKELLVRNLQTCKFTSCRFYFLSYNFNYRFITTFILKPWSPFKGGCRHVLRNQYFEHEIFCFAKGKSTFIVFYLNTKH